jgi:hypothetical protein
MLGIPLKIPEALTLSNNVKAGLQWLTPWQNNSILGDARSTSHPEETSIMNSEHLLDKTAFLLHHFCIPSRKYLCDCLICTGRLTILKHTVHFCKGN